PGRVFPVVGVDDGAIGDRSREARLARARRARDAQPWVAREQLFEGHGAALSDPDHPDVFPALAAARTLTDDARHDLPQAELASDGEPMASVAEPGAPLGVDDDLRQPAGRAPDGVGDVAVLTEDGVVPEERKRGVRPELLLVERDRAELAQALARDGA